MNSKELSREQLVAMVDQLSKEVERLEISGQELIRARESLRESEERYRMAFEHTGTAMMIIEEDTSVSMWNHRLEEVTGYSGKEAALGRKWVDFVVEEDLPRLLDLHRKRRENPNSVPNEYEFRIKDKSGEIRNIFMTVNLIPNTKRSLNSLTDITSVKRLEAGLRESQEEYRDLFENANDMIYMHDIHGAITSANAAALQHFGYTREDIGKINIYDSIDPDYIPLIKNTIGNLTERENRSKSLEVSVYTKERSPFWIEVRLRAIWKNGVCTSVQGIARDVTERKRVEEAKLKQVQQEAQDAKSIIENLRRELSNTIRFQSMVSRSPKMQQLFDIIPEVASSAVPVLILGESGTGKELLARSVHELSNRKKHPFIAINCSALPDTLLESELFGYKAGAFTDAKKDKPGRLAAAEGGTLFLDEVGDISPAMQVKLLRVLQEKEYQPLGAVRTESTNVRIIAATNKDMAELVKKGAIREDFYYRLNVVSISVPPLRERRCDIPVLCGYFIEKFNARYSKNIKEVSPEAIDLFMTHNFSGNIRELENVLEHAFIFCKDPVIKPEHLPAEFCVSDTHAKEIKNLSSLTFQEIEKMYIESIMAEVGGNKQEACKRLGVDKTTLYRKIKKLGIKN